MLPFKVKAFTVPPGTASETYTYLPETSTDTPPGCPPTLKGEPVTAVMAPLTASMLSTATAAEELAVSRYLPLGSTVRLLHCRQQEPVETAEPMAVSAPLPALMLNPCT